MKENIVKDSKKNITESVKSLLISKGETITSVRFEGNEVCFRYVGEPLDFETLKKIESLVVSKENFDPDGLNKIIPIGMHGVYTISFSVSEKIA